MRVQRSRRRGRPVAGWPPGLAGGGIGRQCIGCAAPAAAWSAAAWLALPGLAALARLVALTGLVALSRLLAAAGLLAGLLAGSLGCLSSGLRQILAAGLKLALHLLQSGLGVQFRLRLAEFALDLLAGLLHGLGVAILQRLGQGGERLG